MNNIEELNIEYLKINARSAANGVAAISSKWAGETMLALIAQLEAAQKESAIRLEAIEQMRKTVAHNVDRAQTAEAALSAASEKLLVPAGYCLMPESLTAENGAKGALSGEFFTETDITCEECGGDCDEDDPCKHCNDLGVQTVRTAIGWSTIKDIYKMAVDTTAIRVAGFTVEGE